MFEKYYYVLLYKEGDVMLNGSIYIDSNRNHSLIQARYSSCISRQDFTLWGHITHVLCHICQNRYISVTQTGVMIWKLWHSVMPLYGCFIYRPSTLIPQTIPITSKSWLQENLTYSLHIKCLVLTGGVITVGVCHCVCVWSGYTQAGGLLPHPIPHSNISHCPTGPTAALYCPLT